MLLSMGGGWGCNFERFADEQSVVIEARSADQHELRRITSTMRYGDLLVVNAPPPLGKRRVFMMYRASAQIHPLNHLMQESLRDVASIASYALHG